MEGENTSADETRVAWVGSALVLTAGVGIAAKILGVVVAPGMRGIGSQRTMETLEFLSATLGYAFAALLAMLICSGAFALSRVRKIGVVSRGAVVALSGVVVALVSPAIVQRLPVGAAVALALLASVIAIVAAIGTIGAPQTRIVGAMLGMLGVSGLLRPLGWLFTALAHERVSLGLYNAGRGVGTVALVMQLLAALAAAAWLGTLSRFRGRILTNGAILLACVLTYLAARPNAPDGPIEGSMIEAVLHNSLSQAVGFPLPYGLSSIAAFLVPATILLALVAVLQRARSSTVLAVLALALLSHSAFDVPLQALAITAAGQWAMLVMAGAQRAGVQQPRSLPSPNA